MKKFFLPAIFLFALASCTKNSLDNEAEIGFAAKEFTNQFVRIGTTPVTINIILKSDGNKKINKDALLNIQVSPQDLTAYNISHGTNYSMLPDSCYSVSNFSITIHKGESEASLPVIFYPSKINAYQKFVLPIRLAATSQGSIDPGSNTLLLRVMLANDYTGLYTDTVTCKTPTCIPIFSCINYIDTVITKPVTAISPDSCIMDIGVPGLNTGFTYLRVNPNNSVDIFNEMSLGGILNSATGTYVALIHYFNLPYNVGSLGYPISQYNPTGGYMVLYERLTKL